MEVLSRPDSTHAIAWLPHGRAFVILDPDALVLNVLPRHLSSSGSLQSFMKRLYTWGIRKIKSNEPDAGAYCNDLFVRDTPDMCHAMKRRDEKRGRREEGAGTGAQPAEKKKVEARLAK